VKVIARNKLAFLPSPTRPPRNVKPISGAAHAVAYYPGCSLHSLGEEFNTSTKAVCAALEIDLIEPHSWVCCGSSAAHRADPDEALRLPMENLAIVEQSGFNEVTMPCAACFNRHKAAQHEIRHNSQRKALVDQQIGYEYEDSVRVSTLLETIHEHVGVEAVSAKVSHPLTGLKVVSYYGCLLTRPPEVTEAAHPENPTNMDELVEAMGAIPVDWSYKTQCCGAAHSLSRTDVVYKLSSGLIEHARDAGADAIAVACPLCHLNLDARQFQMDLDGSPMPVLYFTQLLALALGLPEKAAALHKNLVDPKPVLRQAGLLG
jgi:heterodisulfide reductase subunit B